MVRFTTILSTLAVTTASVQAFPGAWLLQARQNIPDPAGDKNVGNGKGLQFIGGQCLSEADCGSQCCATLARGGDIIGVCSGLGAQFQAGKQGCGFGSTAAGSNSTGTVGNVNLVGNKQATNGTTPATGGGKKGGKGKKKGKGHGKKGGAVGNGNANNGTDTSNAGKGNIDIGNQLAVNGTAPAKGHKGKGRAKVTARRRAILSATATLTTGPIPLPLPLATTSTATATQKTPPVPWATSML
ncbi:hypothetical protein NEUTE2DRAFT_48810 [Neurospora tetrasperma FGSC 2509]|nr:hypothetical protein NEUTE2DRAFT_48810 [Neurospora tetrasperma FGSC 2509]